MVANQEMNSLPIWQCRKTGDCCKRFLSTGPRVTLEERQIIANSLDSKEIADHIRSMGLTKESIIRYMENHYSLPLQNKDTCAFLKNNECLIHQIQPILCKTYPLVIKKKGDKTEILVDLDCPRGEELVKAIKNNDIPAYLGIQGPVVVYGENLLEEAVREKYGEDA